VGGGRTLLRCFVVYGASDGFSGGGVFCWRLDLGERLLAGENWIWNCCLESDQLAVSSSHTAESTEQEKKGLSFVEKLSFIFMNEIEDFFFG
jgi:hypothetical protein